MYQPYSSTYSRYFYKCEKYCDEIDPFSLPKIFCQDDFPVGLNYLDIMKYVIDGDSRYTENTFKSYRSLDAYKFYQAGWVHEVFAKQTSIGYIIVGSVKHSAQRLHEKDDLKCWVAIDKENIVLTGHCTCMPDMAEVCSHTTALLFLVADRTDNINLTQSTSEVSCTDTLAQWPVPKVSGEIKMDKIRNMEWDFKPRKKASSSSSAEVLPPWTSEIDEILKAVRDSGQVSAIMTLREPFAEHFHQNNAL